VTVAQARCRLPATHEQVLYMIVTVTGKLLLVVEDARVFATI